MWTKWQLTTPFQTLAARGAVSESGPAANDPIPAIGKDRAGANSGLAAIDPFAVGRSD